MPICLDCRDVWLRALSRKERKALEPKNRRGRKLSEFYPAWVFHSEPTRKCAKHHAQTLADGAKRRAAKLNATPSWADRKAIAAIYREAKRLEKETGQKMHVDHIIPLRGKTVTGLHVEGNLQILPARENVRKSNRWPH